MSDTVAGGAPAVVGALPSGASPWALARRRLLRNKVAMTMLFVLVIIVAACLAAPLYAKHVAHTDPFRSQLDATTVVNGKTVPVMHEETGGLGLGVTPIGPTWDPAHYFLGADNQGRDVAARLLYGGRNSLLIGFFATLITCLIATLIGLVAGFFGGPVDGILSRALDIVWAFPVYLLAISLSTVLLTSGVAVGPFRLEAGSLLLPIGIIGLVYIPYVARPIRGEVLSLRRREFVEAAIGLGASSRRLLWSDILPNVITTVIVFFPLVMAIDDADRGGALVPLDRRPASGRELGNDHPGRRRADLHAAGGRARAGDRDRRHGPRAQRARRRHPRRARPARQAQRRSTPDGAVHGPPPRIDAPRHVLDQRPRLPDLLRDARCRPGGADRGKKRRPADAGAQSGRTSGSTSRCPSSTR